MKKTALFCLLFILSLSSSLVQGINNQYVAGQITENSRGMQTNVSYTGTDTYYNKPASTYIKNLNVTVKFDSDNEFNIIIEDADNARFKLPYEAPYSFTKEGAVATNPLYNVQIVQEPFSIQVTRKATNEVVFDTSSFDFVYSDYYLSFGTVLPSQYLYGLGERRRDFLYDSGLYTIWNKDQYCQIDAGQGGQQTYGTHPMYMMREASGNWHVVYLRNSNGMDFNYNADAKSLQYFITGGILEFKFFFGTPNPEDALKLYHNYINGWTLLPFWSHGYHQSKYGIIYLEDMLDVLSNMTYYKLPIDVIWSDIDYMYSFTDFTIDNQRYPVEQFREMAEKIHWVPIMDAGISLNTTAESYLLGQEMDIWIKSGNNNTNPLVGVVWPGVVHWPDWLHPNTSKYWEQLFTTFFQEAPFAGIWLDMNENSNFCTGESPNNCAYLADYLPDGVYPGGNTIVPEGDQNPNLPPSNWTWLNSSALPYVPGSLLEAKSISINALHYDGSIELNMHNLNGFLETQATYGILQKFNGERPFILSRSTHVGSGQFAAHWSGDNYASWEFLQLSISCIFNFQLYGIPMTGDDICGFAGNTTPELCARWMQLGAFYPFMRNHMAINTVNHYPYSLGDDVLHASKHSLKFRYSILKFYYSLFVKNGGQGTVFKPVFFDFPNDVSLLSLDTQFLVGSELMAAAVTQAGQTEVTVYFPQGARWYDFFTGELVFDANQTAASLNFPAPLNGTLPVFIKGGSIIPVQNTDDVINTKDLTNVTNLVVALSNASAAHGHILGIANYSDDTSLDQCTNGYNCVLDLTASYVSGSDGTVSLTVTASANNPYTALEDVYIANVTFYGVTGANGAVVCVNEPTAITMNGSFSFNWNGSSCQVASDKKKLISA